MIENEKTTVLELMPYEYGVMSSRFKIQAPNKLTAYAVMVVHYRYSPHLVAIYSPEESKEDSWLSIDGKCSERLDEIFGGEGSFDKYINDNIEEIRAYYKTVERLV